MAKLKEYEKHISDTHADHKGKAWCGADVTDWAFVSVDHAAMNARSGGRLVPCPRCLAAVRAAFDSQES